MEGQLNLSTQKTLKNIVLYFLLFLAGDFINSLVWDLFFSVVELPYRELYSAIGLFNIQALAILAIQGFFELLVSLKTLQIGGTSNTKITRLQP